MPFTDTLSRRPSPLHRGRRHRLLTALVLAATSSCVSVPTVPPAQVLAGTATLPPSKRVAVFMPTCKGATEGCTPAFVSGSYGRVVSELESAGITVVPGDELLATMRERTTFGAGLDAVGVGGTRSVGPAGGSAAVGAELLSVSATASLDKGGAGYRDLPPAQRRELLAQARVDGVLWLTVLVGADTMPASPWYELHLYEMTGRLVVGETEEAAWTSRCATVGENTQALGGVGRSISDAGDELARCVVTQALR